MPTGRSIENSGTSIRRPVAFSRANTLVVMNVRYLKMNRMPKLATRQAVSHAFRVRGLSVPAIFSEANQVLTVEKSMRSA